MENEKTCSDAALQILCRATRKDEEEEVTLRGPVPRDHMKKEGGVAEWEAALVKKVGLRATNRMRLWEAF